MKATKVQKERLAQINRKQLRRSGRFSVYYHMQNASAPTRPIIDRLEENGWIAWDSENYAYLTDAGREALK
ncbi:MAG: hypothetical protein NTX28_07745 [Novosphingobium sp.]|nr:hypothetical protein [Novosphingobium sp.]